MSTTAIATAPNNALSNGAAASLSIAVDQSAILKSLGLNPTDPRAQALVVVCTRYGLDPLLKHAVLIKSQQGDNLYITRDGLMHVAHSSGRFDGMEVETLDESATHFVARATVYRNDMTRPFTFCGRYPKGGHMAKFGPEMAEKVAICRALRHAFSVSLCSREETWEEEADAAPLVVVDEQPARPTPANPPQRPLSPAPSRPIPAAAPAPTPPSAPEPAKPAVAATDPVEAAKTARTAFAVAARDLGCDVMSDTDPDMFHMLKCKDLCTKVRTFLGLPTKEKYTVTEDWAQAEAGLETYLRRSETSTADTATNASFREDDLEDPFADDVEDAGTSGG